MQKSMLLLPAIREIPGASPLTPPVVQHPTLQPRHLPPATLPFSGISARIAAETQRAEEISQEQEEARAVLQQAELSASQTQLERESELQHARRTIQLLEENQMGSGAPSFTPTLTSPPQGFTSHLTPSSHPVPATPATLRGPWAATRERLQQTAAPSQAFPSPCLSVPSSSGLPSLSGACSVPGVACPAFASPTPVTAPTTPYQGLPHLQMPLQPPLQPQNVLQQDEAKIDFKREKSALPKLQIKGGDATSITRTIHEWLQRTSLTLNTWSASAVQLWHNAVAVAKAAHQQWTSMTPSQRALQTGLPSTGHALPAQLSVLEAIMRSDLCNHCLPEKIQSLAVQKGAHTVSDLLYLTFQSYLPSEPIARVEGLATIEAPVKPSRTFGEALSFLRSWRQQVITVVHDLGGNPEPLKLFQTLRTLVSSLVSSDNAFAMELSQIYKQTNIKTICTDVSLLTTIDLLEVELSSRALEEEDERRRHKAAGVAVASFTSTGSGSGKGSTKPICRDFLTENGCSKGGQCTFQHPTTVGRCLRCGSTRQVVADCKRPRKDSTTLPGNKGKGKSKNAALPKSSSQPTAGAKAKPKPDAKKKAAAKPKGKGKAMPKASASSSSSTQAMHVLMWAEDQSMEVVDETLPSASHVDAWSYSACTFYTTFTPAFHSSEPVDADGILPPILDTGATHCLLPLKWMTNEQAETCKKIHLKVASGATVRALLHENIIYCSTVSRPLVSVGQLKTMLDLRLIWDDSSPKVLTCSGGLRYTLIEAAVFHNLPVISQEELHVLLGAIHDFTQKGILYNAATWAQKLGRKLSLYHWSTPTTSLPPEHSEFTEDPQVNFSSMLHSSSHRTLNVPSTVQIIDLEEENPTTDDETAMTETKPNGCFFTLLASCFFTLHRKLLLYLACKLLMGLPLQWMQCLLLLRRTLQMWKKLRSCCFIMLCPRPGSGPMSTKTATSRGGDFLEHLRLEAKELLKPLFGFRKLSLRFICWLLPDPLDLLLNPTCLHN